MLDTNLLGCRRLVSSLKDYFCFYCIFPNLCFYSMFEFIIFSEGEKLSMHKFKEKYLAHFHHTIMQDIKMISFNVKGAQVWLKK